MLDAAEVGFLQHNLHHVLKKTSPTFQLGENYMMDLHQHNSILSDAPAILLQSGAGTGKTTVLAGRIAYLLKTKQVEPKNMIILSFTRRDAEALKDKALEILFNNVNNGNKGVDSMPQENVSFTRDSLKEQLWCGTIHSFAINILKKYNFNNVPLRIISTQEMKTRVRNCLGRIHGSDKHRMMLYKAAMEQSKQSIGTLVNDVIRCLELWKEAGVLFTPYAYTIHNLDVRPEQELRQDDYVELAMRLGISQEVARLALDISGDYQVRLL
jgi:superfamily I DNA/RNA helicase